MALPTPIDYNSPVAVNPNINPSYNKIPNQGPFVNPQNVEGGKNWNYMSIDAVNIDGNPLLIRYYLNKILQVTKTITYNNETGDPETITLS
jgi:hypothetical protein